MTYIQKIGEYKDELINLVESFMIENELEKVIFKNPFEAVHSEYGFDYQYLVEVIVNSLSSESGKIECKSIETGYVHEISINDLGIVEVAHILDELEAGNYEIKLK